MFVKMGNKVKNYDGIAVVSFWNLKKETCPIIYSPKCAFYTLPFLFFVELIVFLSDYSNTRVIWKAWEESISD